MIIGALLLRGMIISRPPFFGGGGRPFGGRLGPRRGICSPTGSSTITWRTPSGRAIGVSTMRAKPESSLRSTLATLATGRPGG